MIISRADDLEKAIRVKDIRAVIKIFFPSNQPIIGNGFMSETELWDYKLDSPKKQKNNDNAWAHVAKDVLAFHNNKGGVIIYGIKDGDYTFRGATTAYDSKEYNDKIRKYIGDRFWIEYHRIFIQSDQKYLGIAIIPPRGPSLVKFASNSPKEGGKHLFVKGDSALRKGDESKRILPADCEILSRKMFVPKIGEIYNVNEPYYRLLAPEYPSFILRKKPCSEIERALIDPRTSVVSLTGIGGVGKTALATWAVQRAYDIGQFSSIISITAKDRELTKEGIISLDNRLGSYEILLDDILDVTGFGEIKTHSLKKREGDVRALLTETKTLLYVDNLETVGDKRIIDFLDDLPLGARAIVTSRRSVVRVSVRPVEIGPMEQEETLNYMKMLSSQQGYNYLRDMSSSEYIRIGDACDGIPLAITWAVCRSESKAEVLLRAERITQSQKSEEELLEFAFRRVFDSLSDCEKTILRIISIFQRPLQTEALMIGGKIGRNDTADSLETLIRDSLVARYFDQKYNDYSYSMMPVTKAFVYGDVRRNLRMEEKIRRRLSDYYEARDVPSDQRVVIRSIRQGIDNPETPLIDIAISAKRTGRFDDAEELLRQALERNPRSWKAAKLLAELYRHELNNCADALKLYERAAANAPRAGSDRAMIYREWGILLRDSGNPGATNSAIEKLRIAIQETPNDPIALVAYSQLLATKGRWRPIIKLLEPLKNHPSLRTRDKVQKLLFDSYKNTGEMLKLAEMKQEIRGN